VCVYVCYVYKYLCSWKAWVQQVTSLTFRDTVNEFVDAAIEFRELQVVREQIECAR
jgi:hypothetical protein